MRLHYFKLHTDGTIHHVQIFVFTIIWNVSYKISFPFSQNPILNNLIYFLQCQGWSQLIRILIVYNYFLSASSKKTTFLISKSSIHQTTWLIFCVPKMVPIESFLSISSTMFPFLSQNPLLDNLIYFLWSQGFSFLILYLFIPHVHDTIQDITSELWWSLEYRGQIFQPLLRFHSNPTFVQSEQQLQTTQLQKTLHVSGQWREMNLILIKTKKSVINTHSHFWLQEHCRQMLWEEISPIPDACTTQHWSTW